MILTSYNRHVFAKNSLQIWSDYLIKDEHITLRFWTGGHKLPYNSGFHVFNPEYVKTAVLDPQYFGTINHLEETTRARILFTF